MSYMIMAHNAMSYLKPKRWWMLPWRFVARTQKRSVTALLSERGIRCFDIRVRPGKCMGWVFAHGSMEYKCEMSPDELFDILNSLPEWMEGERRVWVRLILEYSRKPKNWESASLLFQAQCSIWREKFPNIVFFEFRRKWDWVKVYSYKEEPVPSLHQAVGSMAGRKLLCWWPWLYAWINNESALCQGTDCDMLALDFID